MKKFYTYFKTNTGKMYKSLSIISFSDWADINNVADWWVVQEAFIDCEEV